jgi:hypothetical protein
LQASFIDAGTAASTREVLEAYAADHERAVTPTRDGA